MSLEEVNSRSILVVDDRSFSIVITTAIEWLAIELSFNVFNMSYCFVQLMSGSVEFNEEETAFSRE